MGALLHQVRMLGAEGSPNAFPEMHGMWMELRRVCQPSDGLHFEVRIISTASHFLVDD